MKNNKFLNFNDDRTYYSFIKMIVPYLFGNDFATKIKWGIAALTVILSILLGLGVPLALKELVSILSSKDTHSYQIVFFVVAVYGASWTLNQFMINLRGILMWPVGEKAIKNLSMDIFSHLHRLSANFHANRSTGMITSAIDKVQSNFIDSFWGLIFFVFPTTIELFLSSMILWKLCGFWYGFTLLTMLIIFVIVSIKGNKWSLIAQAESNEHHAQSNAIILDSLLNSSTVKYFNNELYERNRCDKILTKREKLISKAVIHSELVRIYQFTIIGIGLTILMSLAGFEVIKGTMDVSRFILINSYTLQFVTPLGFFGLIFRNSRQALVNIESALSILEIDDIIKDLDGSSPLKQGPREITFKNLWFEYSSERAILEDISFTIPAKKKTAIVGFSGSGKSTLINLLFRLYDPTKGKIFLDSQDIKEINQYELQKAIGVIPQDIVLFNMTLYENILYGNLNATRQEVEKVCEICHLNGFISQLPSGLDTIVGERGLKISGGERQRVGIARALLKKPEIFIFDEATSSLDLTTEMAIQKDIEIAVEGVTTLIIAHRLQTVVNCSKIIVIESGKIIEEGSHEELLNKGGAYYAMWTKQNKN